VTVSLSAKPVGGAPQPNANKIKPVIVKTNLILKITFRKYFLKAKALDEKKRNFLPLF